MAHEHDAPSADGGEASGHGVVVADVAVAVEFDEFAEASLDVIKHVGPHGVAGDLHALPGGEVLISLGAQLFYFLLHGRGLFVHVDVLAGALLQQLIELFLEFEDGFFKFERCDLHAVGKSVKRGRRLRIFLVCENGAVRRGG